MQYNPNQRPHRAPGTGVDWRVGEDFDLQRPTARSARILALQGRTVRPYPNPDQIEYSRSPAAPPPLFRSGGAREAEQK